MRSRSVAVAPCLGAINHTVLSKMAEASKDEASGSSTGPSRADKITLYRVKKEWVIGSAEEENTIKALVEQCRDWRLKSGGAHSVRAADTNRRRIDAILGVNLPYISDDEGEDGVMPVQKKAKKISQKALLKQMKKKPAEDGEEEEDEEDAADPGPSSNKRKKGATKENETPEDPMAMERTTRSMSDGTLAEKRAARVRASGTRSPHWWRGISRSAMDAALTSAGDTLDKLPGVPGAWIGLSLQHRGLS